MKNGRWESVEAKSEWVVKSRVVRTVLMKSGGRSGMIRDQGCSERSKNQSAP